MANFRSEPTRVLQPKRGPRAQSARENPPLRLSRLLTRECTRFSSYLQISPATDSIAKARSFSAQVNFSGLFPRIEKYGEWGTVSVQGDSTFQKKAESGSWAEKRVPSLRVGGYA
jgi:hypothetical protein